MPLSAKVSMIACSISLEAPFGKVFTGEGHALSHSEQPTGVGNNGVGQQVFSTFFLLSSA